MASSTLQYIAWPVTLGLSFMAGGIDLSSEPPPDDSKGGNQPVKVSHRNPASNDSTSQNSAAINRRTVSTRSRVSNNAHTESYDIKEITNISDSRKRMAKFLIMIDQLGPGDFEQTVADFRGLGLTNKRIIEYELLLDAWAKVNPEGALAYAKENNTRPFATRTILNAWAGYAPDAAIEWAKLKQKGDITNQYLITITAAIAITDPERAADLLLELPLSAESTNLAFDRIIPHVSKLGSEKAFAWLATIKDEKLHARATVLIPYLLAKQEPQATIDWLQTFPADTQKTVHGRAMAMTIALAELDIGKALEWTDSLEGVNRSISAQRLIRQLASSDPNKAATWMKTMSNDPRYKSIVSIFLSSAGPDHPEIALANLDQLSDVYRKGAREKILLGWADGDKVAVTKWMQSNNIDTATQKRILATAAQGFGRRHGKLRPHR